MYYAVIACMCDVTFAEWSFEASVTFALERVDQVVTPAVAAARDVIDLALVDVNCNS